MAEEAYIGLGCNLGNRAATLRAGLAALRRAGLDVSAVSSLYLTEPEIDPAAEGAKHHPWYVNCVVRVDRPPEASDLLRKCMEIETQFGRVRKAAGTAPRTLDLDLLLYGDEQVAKPDFLVPHPRLHVRRFVLLPMTEIAPGLVHPVENATMSELLDRLPKGKGVWFMAPPPDPEDWREAPARGAE
jgi:2-amino-4-hydroxy-6-hydroxymethyldihydropteridine diphosphokinase